MSFNKIYTTIEKIKNEGISTLEVQQEGCLPVAFSIENDVQLTPIANKIIKLGNDIGGTLLMTERQISKDIIRLVIIKKPVTA
jgi:biotin operon repressor